MDTELTLKPDSKPVFKSLPGEIIENLLEGCQLIGHDERYLNLNKTAAMHGGKQRDELIGKTITEAYPGVESTLMYSVLRKCLALREVQIMENEFTYPDGKKRWFELRFEPVPEGVFILSLDISERKKTENQNLVMKNRLEALTRVIQDISRTKTQGGIVDIINLEAQILFQADKVSVYMKSENQGYFLTLKGKDIDSLLCFNAARNGETLLIKDILNDNSLSGDAKNPGMYQSAVVVPLNKEIIFGSIGVFWARPYAPTGEDVHILQTLCNSVSVALERIRMYEDLETSNKQYRDLVENLNDVVFYLNSKGQFVYISPVVEKFGYSPHDMIGKSFWEFVHPDDVEHMKHRFSNAISGNASSSEFRAYDRNGLLRHIRVSSRNVVQNGQPIGVTGVLVDQTEKRNTEDQLRTAQRMEAIGTLAGGIAHDFNNILSSIIGFSELSIEETDPESEVGGYLSEIFNAGNRAKDLVRQILTFARQSDVEFKPIQVSSIAKEVLKFIRSSTPSTIQIKSQINSRSLIQGNATQIHQIFMNLLTNAIHALEDREDGELQVEVKDIYIEEGAKDKPPDLTPGSYLYIRVADNGAGIDPDILPNIFEPYFTTKETGKGTGMGLSIVHGIVETYHGKMVVDSTPGSGTSFSIYFPASREQIVHPKTQPDPLPRGHERILCVDDELSIARMIADTLGRLGYTVVIKTDSSQALKEFRSNPDGFDLVMTDMTMPHMTGDLLARRLMEIRHDIPVIVCTGYSKKISKEKSDKIGIKALIHKPLLKADIAHVVRNVLDAKKGDGHATMHSGD